MPWAHMTDLLTMKLSTLRPCYALRRQVNIINFTVTRSGLEEQLLSDVVSREKPELENKKNRLLVTMAADKKQLRVRLLSYYKNIV